MIQTYLDASGKTYNSCKISAKFSPFDALENDTSLEEAKELIKQRTRNYAKRQVTYFKHQLPVEIYEDKESLLKAI